jgi:5,10-methylenetetrahydromethanopterin reductase
MSVTFSVCLPCSYPADTLAVIARRIEALGFRSLWLTDMVLQTYDVFACLSVVAASTRQVRIGACVLHPQVRHFAVSLNGMVTVDRMTGGRAIFGIGTGGAEVVAELGFQPASRAVMREIVQLSRRLMRGETVDASVRPIQLCGARLRLLPKAPLPIYLAATGPKMLELAGEVADGVFAHVGASGATVGFARASCERGLVRRPGDLGPLDFSTFVHASVARERKTALAECRAGALRVATRFPRYAELVGFGSDEIARLRSVGSGVFDGVPESLVHALTLSGTVEDCIDKVDGMARAGVSHITLFPVAKDTRRFIETFGQEVVPQFRQ